MALYVSGGKFVTYSGRIFSTPSGETITAFERLRDYTVNLSPPVYYGGIYPFINLVRISVEAWDAPGPIYTNSTGWLQAVPPNNTIQLRVVFALSSTTGYFPPGNYRVQTKQGMYCTVSASADLTVTQQGINSGTQSLRDALFTVADKGTSGIYQVVLSVQVTNPLGSGTNMDCTDLYIGLDSSLASYNAGEIFAPAFLSDFTNVRAIKFSDWTFLNEGGANYFYQYSQLAKEANRTWAKMSAANPGVPYSVCAKLCKKLGCVHWFCVPICYDGPYCISAVAATDVISVVNDAGTPASVPWTTDQPVVFWDYEMRGSPQPPPLLWATKYFWQPLTSSTGKVSATAGGSPINITADWAFNYLDVRRISPLYDPATFYAAIVNEIYNADPHGYVIGQIGLEPWNYGYYFNQMQGIMTVNAGTAPSSGNAGYGLAWQSERLWQAIETVFPRTHYVRSIEQQGVFFGQIGSSFTYSDPGGMFGGAQIKDLVDCASVAYYPALGRINNVTITIASPAVVTQTAHQLTAFSTITFTTTGTLPSGIGLYPNQYYPVNIAVNTYQISTSPGGSPITTTGSQSGTHSAYADYSFLDIIAAGGVTWTDTQWSNSIRAGVDNLYLQALYYKAQQDAVKPGIPIVTYEGGPSGTMFISNTSSSVVTMTIASPCVVTWAGSGFSANASLSFSTSGTLPTGITAGTVYYVVPGTPSGGTFQISSTINGSAVNTSGSQSGTHVGSTATTANVDLANRYFSYAASSAAGTDMTYFINNLLRAVGIRNNNQYTAAGAWNASTTLVTAWGLKRATELPDTPQVTAAKGTQLVIPTLISANVANLTPNKIDLTWSDDIDAAISAPGAFLITGTHPLTSHVVTGARTTQLTTSANFIGGESETITYTQPGLNNMKDTFGALVVNFAGFAITNSITTSFVRYTLLENGNATESGGGGSPYSYSTTFPAGSCKLAGADHKFPAGVEASLVIKCTAIGPDSTYGTLACFDTSQNSFTNANTSLLGMIASDSGSSGGRAWFSLKNSGATQTNSGIASVVNSYIKIRRDVSNVLYGYASSDGVTFNLIDSIAGANVDYWPKAEVLSAGSGTFTIEITSQTGMT
jgi:hypothetical protein